MPKLTDWRWWTGSLESVEDDGVYDIGEFDTRYEAVAAGLRETTPGEQFRIIEARLWDRKTEPEDGIDRFARVRNGETLTNGPREDTPA